MSTDEAVRSMRALWQLPRVRRLRAELEPLVAYHTETMMSSIVLTPPPGTTYCVALSATWERSPPLPDTCAYGLEADRVALIEADEHLNVWNASLFDEYFDASRGAPPEEELMRKRLVNQGFGGFDYWLMSEVAHRLNHTGITPAHATQDFVFFYEDNELSTDFELALAYTTPEPTYSGFVARRLARPSQERPGSVWIDVE